MIYFRYDEFGRLYPSTAYSEAEPEDLGPEKAWRKYVEAIKEASRP